MGTILPGTRPEVLEKGLQSMRWCRDLRSLVGYSIFLLRSFPLMKLRYVGLLGVLLAFPACYDFHTVGPEDPAPQKSPNTVSVSIVYLRPEACINTGSACGGPRNLRIDGLCKRFEANP